MDYLKEFLNLEEYETYKDGEDFALPNVSLVNNPYSVKYTPYTPPNYFRITNLENVGGVDSGIYFDAVRSSSYPQDESYPITLEYCVNGDGVWTSITDEEHIEIPLPANGYVELRGNNESMCNYRDDDDTYLYWNLSVDFNHSLSGDIMSICGFSDTLENRHFYRFFQVNTSLIDASNLILSATVLEMYCYYWMFAGCTSLTTVPELPATILEDYCYSQMFRGCTNLVTAPELPATTLAYGCYYSMFYGCTDLTTAPELPATTLVNSCYSHMFEGCTNLTKAPELPATTLTDYCYSYMFNRCTNLMVAPELPATTLTSACYSNMFENCTSLNYIKAMFITTPGINYTNNWVYGVASTGTFVKNPAATWDVTGYSGVPTGWTVQTASE